mmetsp:Transcript_15509/g.48230  ORF Transcript_15509/g.48230 Transcript_15509/m.48230 type:complete len:464 (-) Transcript_15509:30-1421(-)
MEEAERARASLEVKLASAEKLLKEREAASSRESSDLVATLRTELVEEKAFRARLERSRREGRLSGFSVDGNAVVGLHSSHCSASPNGRRLQHKPSFGESKPGQMPLRLAVRLALKLEALDWRRLEERPLLLPRLRDRLQGVIAAAAGSKIHPEHVELLLPEGPGVVVATVLPPLGISASSVQAKLKAPALLQTVTALLAEMPELAEVADGRVGVAEVCVSLAEPPAGNAGKAVSTLRDAAGRSEGRAPRERESRRARRALEDAIVLASRIQLLRTEGLQTKKRIRQIQEKKRAIIIASHCAQQFAWPSNQRRQEGRTLQPPPSVGHAADEVLSPPVATGEAATPAPGIAPDAMVALVLHMRLAATKRSLAESNAMLKTSLALTVASAAARPARASASSCSFARGQQASSGNDLHESAVLLAVKARLAASKASMARLNGVLKKEVDELRRSPANLSNTRSHVEG